MDKVDSCGQNDHRVWQGQRFTAMFQTRPETAQVDLSSEMNQAFLEQPLAELKGVFDNLHE